MTTSMLAVWVNQTLGLSGSDEYSSGKLFGWCYLLEYAKKYFEGVNTC